MSPKAQTTTSPPPTTLPEFRAAIDRLDDQLHTLDPVEVARLAAQLISAANPILSPVRRAAIYRATRTLSHAEVADQLDVSPAAINKAVTLRPRQQPST